jgi:nuclear pore complex protein Nup93
MSLFGNLNANTSQNKPSLFGAPATSSQTPSLFNGLNASKPAQSGLFGTTTSQAPQSSTGLFGLTTTAPSTQPQFTGAFGAATGAQSQPQTTSLFGNTTTAQSTQPQQTTGFGGSLLSGGPQRTQQSDSRSHTAFDGLLEKSRKRARGETGLEDLPSLQLGLGDLRQRLRSLGPSSQDRANSGKAHYLLAGSGVDPSATARELRFFESQTATLEKPASAAVPDTDVESYLANLQTQTTLGMIADGLARSVRDFDAFLDDNVTMEWDAQRKRVYEHFGIKPKDNLAASARGGSFGGAQSELQSGFGRSARRGKGQSLAGSKGPGTPGASTFGRSNLQRSVIGTPAPIGSSQQNLFADVEKKTEATGSNTTAGPADRFVREKQRKFIEKVQSLNVSRLRGEAYPVIQEFADVEAQTNDTHVQHVVNAYKALIEMVGEDPYVKNLSDPQAVKERQFADAYLDETPNSSKAMAVRKRILAGTNRFLEKQFFQEMEALVAKNPREANLGGVPSITSKVRAYVRLRAARKDLAPDNTELQMINDDYAWALIFYLLRSGHIKEATEYVASNSMAFRAIDRNFVTYITDFYNSSDRRLKRELQDRISNEYNQRVHIAPEDSIDPFRMACYKVIGRCGLDDRSLRGLLPSMDDFIWLQFTLAREVNRVDEIATQMYGLEEARAAIKDVVTRNSARADANTSFGIFFYLKVLAGLFEDAIAYLYPFQYVDAVHFAIALDFYGLLRVSDPSAPEGDLLTRSVRGLPQISFGRMLGYYTRDFRAANVGAAVDYLTLICLNKDLPGDSGIQQAALCHEALRELVLESREFATLLGDIRGDGTRIKGSVEERMKLIGLEDTGDFMRTVTIQAASIADDNGRTTDAVLLFHLAEEYDNVIFIINRALSEAVAISIGQDQLQLAPLKPRIDASQEQKQAESLSLTAVDDPVVLARNMLMLYNSNAMVKSKIRKENREACGVLLGMSSAKAKVAEGQWTEALDVSLRAC